MLALYANIKTTSGEVQVNEYSTEKEMGFKESQATRKCKV